MSIQFNPSNKTFKLDTANTSYVIYINRYGYLLHLYYGVQLPDDELEYLAYTA